MPFILVGSILVHLGIVRIASSCCIDEGEEHWVFAVSRSIVVAGDVVGDGDLVGGLSSWCCEELGTSIVADVLRVLFFLSFPIHRSFLLQ